MRAILSLIRWPNALLAASGVFVGAWWANGPVGTRLAFAVLAAVALTAAANTWNDLADTEIDRIAHPDRPLPSGELNAKTAVAIAWIAAGAAPVLAFAAHPALGALSCLVLVLMYFYNIALKRRGLPGNVTVAVLASLPFLYGAWAVRRPGAGLALTAVAAPLHLAREISKDLDDAAADATWRRTIPVALGTRTAWRAMVASLVLFLAALAPLVLSRPLLAAALAPAIALSATAVVMAFRGKAGGPALFKAAMLCAMAAFVLAAPRAL